MNLQGLNLSLRMRGKSVHIRQTKLCQLGFSIDDKQEFFHKITQQTVMAFRRTARWIRLVWAREQLMFESTTRSDCEQN